MEYYWTLVWTLVFANIIRKPYIIKVLTLNYPQPSLGDNYSIVEKEGVSYFFVDIYRV